MQDRNADELLERLQDKVQRGMSISREELVQLTLCPLMGGKKSQKERIQAAYAITMNTTEIDPEEVGKIEAVIYAMADKFLESSSIGNCEKTKGRLFGPSRRETGTLS